MASRPLHSATWLLGAALALTAVMSLTAEGLLSTAIDTAAGSPSVTERSPETHTESPDAIAPRQSIREHGPTGRRHKQAADIELATVADIPPSEVLADGPAAGEFPVRTVKQRNGKGSGEWPKHPGYQELPPPPGDDLASDGGFDSEFAGGFPSGASTPLHRVDRSTPVSPGRTGPAVLPTGPSEAAAPLASLVTELSLLRQDLQQYSAEARQRSVPEPADQTLVKLQELQRLEALHHDVRRIADRQNDLEQTLRADVETRTRQTHATTELAQVTAAAVYGPGDNSGAAARGRMQLVPSAEDPDRWNARFLEADPAAVIAALADAGGSNVVISTEIDGRVTLVLDAARPEEILQGVAAALNGVLVEVNGLRMLLPKSRAADHRIATERSIAKFIRPRYLRARDVAPCIEPLLTPGLGTLALTVAPAEAFPGEPPSAQEVALLIVDFPEVVEQVEALVREIDTAPEQIEIEAVITTVRTRTRTDMSIIAALQARGACRCLASGGTAAGTCGHYCGSADELLAILNEFSDAHVEATPTLRVLNRQEAQLEIGTQVGYRRQSRFFRRWGLAAEKIDFLPSMTSLSVQPFLLDEETVRLKVHPRVSRVHPGGGTRPPRQEIAEIQTDLVVPLGCTAILGGLIRCDGEQSSTDLPSLRWMRHLSGQLTSAADEQETIEVLILLTPRRTPIASNTEEIGLPGVAGRRQPSPRGPVEDLTVLEAAEAVEPLAAPPVFPPLRLPELRLPEEERATETAAGSSGDVQATLYSAGSADESGGSGLQAIQHQTEGGPVQSDRNAPAEETLSRRARRDRRDAELASVPGPPGPRDFPLTHPQGAGMLTPLTDIPPEPIPAARRSENWIPPPPAR